MRIAFEDVTKKFGETTALSDCSLTIHPEQITVLIGPSGCGKSTLLRHILGLVEPDGGSVSIDDTPLRNRDLQQFRRTLGYVIQDGGLFPHLTARENVLLAPEYMDWSAEQQQQRLDELVDLTGVDRDVLTSYPGELSGGQRQRVSLMRGLFLRPDALLLDEPLRALDPMIRSRLQDELRTIFQKLDMTVVLVTHDMAEANFFGDHIVLMNDGQVVQQGPMSTLLQKPATPFVESFIRAQKQLHEIRNTSDA
jgi:osmoprotectant transport system ATP-binding protein